MNSKERILKVVSGDMVDCIPYTPRLDLWHNANALAQTLPERHKGKGPDQICRTEGWTLHKVVPDFTSQPDPDAMLHRALGVFALREQKDSTHVIERSLGLDPELYPLTLLRMGVRFN